MKPNLETEIAGVKLRNPTVLASGIMSDNADLLIKVGENGAGAVTCKTITKEPREGHKAPTIAWAGEEVMLNAMGIPNMGAEAFVQELKKAKKGKAALIASVGGKSVEEYVDVVNVLKEAGPDLFELNISCPNVGTGMAIGKDPAMTRELVEKVKAATDIPFSVKVTPNADKMVEVAKAAEGAGADAITAINTLGPGMVIDVDKGKIVLTNKTGGLSGPAIKSVAVRCVYDIRKVVDIPIIGVGGVMTGRDAAELLMAGASAVGIGTAVFKKGPGVFKDVCDELGKFMEEKSYKSIKDLVGIVKE